MKKPRKPSKQQQRAADLRAEGKGFAEIARALGMKDRRVAQDVLRAYDAIISGGSVEDRINKTLATKAKEEPTVADLKLSRIRKKKQLVGTKDKTETEQARVLRMMEDARVMALAFMDAETLEKESGRGLAQIVSILTDKIQLLKGEPTSISRVEDVRKMDSILETLEAEIKKRGIKTEKVVN